MDDGLLDVVRRARAEAARGEGAPAEAGKAAPGAGGYRTELGGAAGSCTPVRVTSPAGAVATGWICGTRTRRRPCAFCEAGWQVALCDYPTGGPCPKCKGTGRRGRRPCQPCAGSGYRMCNQPVCATCRAHREPDEDYCPEHRVLAGFPPLVRREPCAWAGGAGELIRRDCLHAGCGKTLAPGDRVLYFPRRRRAMCDACGERYLQIAV